MQANQASEFMTKVLPKYDELAAQIEIARLRLEIDRLREELAMNKRLSRSLSRVACDLSTLGGYYA